MFDRWGVVGLCGLIVLAGCSGGTPGTSSSGPPLSEIEYPDGASADGIDAPRQILDATDERSRETDYISELDRKIVYSDGSTQSTRIEKRASLDSRSAKYELTIDPQGSPRTSSHRFVSGDNDSVSIYLKNTNGDGTANFKQKGPFNAPYRAEGHSLLSEPPVWGWVYFVGILGIENLTATGTTTVGNEPAIVYELTEHGTPGEIGIETIRIVIGSDGTLHRFQLKSRFPDGGDEMKTKYLDFSFEPGDVQVKDPAWLEETQQG